MLVQVVVKGVVKVLNSGLIKSNLMHAQPRHLPRRTWLVRHVGRCQRAGGTSFQ